MSSSFNLRVFKALLDQVDGDRAAAEELAREEADQQQIASLHREGLRGVFSSLALSGGPCAESLQLALKQDYIDDIARHVEWLRILREIAETLETLGLQAIVFKGGAAIQGLYSGLGLRPVSDVDLLTRPADYERIRVALCELDFVPWTGAPHVLDRRGWAIDLHTSPLNQLHLAYPFDLEGAWQRSLPCEEQNPFLRKLSLEDELTVNLLHSSKHAFRRMIWLVDYQLLIRRVNLPLALQTIRVCRAERCLAYAAWLSQRMLGASPPAGMKPIRFNFFERRFLHGVLAREAPEMMGMIMPVFSSTPLRTIRYLRHGLYPDMQKLSTRTQRLRQLFSVLVDFLRESRRRKR